MVYGQQLLLFILVGVTTTAVDFAIFNWLTRRAIGWPRIPANVVSVAVAMAWSFLANWLIVFRPDRADWLGRAGRFLIVTAFSAFVLQNAILYLTAVWKAPVQGVLFLVRKLGLGKRFPDDVWARNTCKTLAVTGGLVWNFCWYKFFVYAD